MIPFTLTLPSVTFLCCPSLTTAKKHVSITVTNKNSRQLTFRRCMSCIDGRSVHCYCCRLLPVYRPYYRPLLQATNSNYVDVTYGLSLYMCMYVCVWFHYILSLFRLRPSPRPRQSLLAAMNNICRVSSSSHILFIILILVLKLYFHPHFRSCGSCVVCKQTMKIRRTDGLLLTTDECMLTADN